MQTRRVNSHFEFLSNFLEIEPFKKAPTEAEEPHIAVRLTKEYQINHIYDDIMNVALRLESDDERITALKEIAVIRAQKGDVQGAHKVTRYIFEISSFPFMRYGSLPKILKEIAIAQIRAGDIKKAKEIVYVVSNLKKIAEILNQRGDIDGAKEMFALEIHTIISSSHDRFNTVSSKSKRLEKIALAQFNCGHAEEEVKKTFLLAATTACAIEFDANKAIVLAGIAKTQAQCGYIEDSKETVFSIKNSDDKSIALKEITAIQAKNGDIEGAMATALLIVDMQVQSKALQEVPIIQARNDDIEGAKRTALLIQDKYTQSLALKEIAVIQVQIDDMDGAVETLLEAKEVTFFIDDKYAQSTALKEIAFVQFECDHFGGAEKTFTAAKEAALLIEDRYVQSKALRKIALFLFEYGDVEESKKMLILAKNAAYFILNHSKQSRALKGIALTQFGCGDIQGAKETYPEIMKWNFHENLKKIVKKQLKMNFIKSASEIALLNDALFHSFLLGEIVQHQIASEDIEGATETFGFVKRKMDQSTLAKEIAMLHIENKNIEKAKKMLRFVHNILDKIELLREIVVLQVQNGDEKCLFSSIKEEICMHIRDHKMKSLQLRKLLEVQVQNDDIEGAKQTAIDIRKATSYGLLDIDALFEIPSGAIVRSIPPNLDTVYAMLEIAEGIIRQL